MLGVKLYCGDCAQVMAGFEPDRIDLTVTSPPYDSLRSYNGYVFDFEAIAAQLWRVTKPGGVVVWVVGDRIQNGDRTLTSFRQAMFFQSISFNVHDVMVYKKKNTPFMRSNAYTNCYEFMFVFSKGKVNTFNRLMDKTVRQGFEGVPFNKGDDGVNRKVLKELKAEKTRVNIWEYAVGLGGTTSDQEAFKHPAVFPEKMAEDHILSWSNPGDTVLDPMMGSGTTGKMAVKYDRSFIGIDISSEYVAIAEKRIAQAQLQTRMEI